MATRTAGVLALAAVFVFLLGLICHGCGAATPIEEHDGTGYRAERHPNAAWLAKRWKMRDRRPRLRSGCDC